MMNVNTKTGPSEAWGVWGEINPPLLLKKHPKLLIFASNLSLIPIIKSGKGPKYYFGAFRPLLDLKTTKIPSKTPIFCFKTPLKCSIFLQNQLQYPF